VLRAITTLGVLLAAMLGFAAGFIIAWFVGIFGTMDSECDGPCFSKWDEVFWVALGVGILSAVGFGIAGRSLALRALARRRDRRTIRRLATETDRNDQGS